MGKKDFEFMKEAFREALISFDEGNVPVGAVVVEEGIIIGRGRNQKSLDPTAHAEIIAIRQACLKKNSWGLQNCTIYVTLEPCPMCAGAIINTRLERVVFGAWDPKAGACGTLYDILRDTRLNHRCEVTGGVMALESRKLLQDFFIKRRQSLKRRDGRVVEGGRLEID